MYTDKLIIENKLFKINLESWFQIIIRSKLYQKINMIYILKQINTKLIFVSGYFKLCHKALDNMLIWTNFQKLVKSYKELLGIVIVIVA
jgi:hypothetical protein